VVAVEELDMKRIGTLLAAMLLPAASIAAPPTAHDYSKRMMALTEIQRFAAVRNAIIENNMWCKRVVALRYQGSHKNLDMWVARCGPKPIADYGVFVGPDGTVQVSTCQDLIRVKWPACQRL
jgi:hypothetical protein